ncbi:MAG: glycosyltransferase [Lachnospiraceae bacterium]|nr:glycosyltransferase [Lachnospiraceae bacterium]
MKRKSSGQNIEFDICEQVKVSVVMPVYNACKYLEQSVESILTQSLSSIELICVDDGSDDDSLDILNRFMYKDRRVIVISQKHSNAGKARNAGMCKASGKYLLFLDADDIFSKNMIEEAYKTAEDRKAEITVFGGNNYSEIKKKTGSNTGLLQMKMVPDDPVFSLKRYRGRISFSSTAPWNKLFLRDFIDKNKLEFQSVKSANDLYFVTMAMLLADRITVIDKQLISYRIDNPDSLQGSKAKSPYDGISALHLIYDEINSRGLYNSCCVDFNERCVAICLYLLRGIEAPQLYEEFYEYLRTEFFGSVGLKNANESDFYHYSLYRELREIMDETAVGYLLKMNKKIRQRERKYWLFPFSEVPSKSRITLYGAGEVGKCFYKQISDSGFCEISEWVDRAELQVDGNKVIHPDAAKWTSDYVVVAVENEEIAAQIRNDLMNRGIEDNRIIWSKIIINESS